MMTLLITRPSEEAGPLARALAEMGFVVFSEPLLEVEYFPENIPAFKVEPQAIIATSKRGISALASVCGIKNIPLFTVGEATAAYAESLGFTVSAYRETAKKLASTIVNHGNSNGSHLFYARGEHITVDIAATLTQAGFSVQSAMVYRAVAVEELSEPLRLHIDRNAIAGVLFFSRRTAAVYAGLVKTHRLNEPHRSMRALCVSTSVADAVAALPWRSTHIALAPDVEHMLEQVKAAF